MRGMLAAVSVVGVAVLAVIGAEKLETRSVVISEIAAATPERSVHWIDSGEPPLDKAQPAWFDIGFDDDRWSVGRGSFGYGDGLHATEVDLRGKAFSLYLRTEFEVDASSAALPGPWILEVDYDDGFVAYLDGRVVARANVGEAGERIGHGRAADSFHEAGLPERFLLPGEKGLGEGRHVLALQGHNVSLGSSDFMLRATIRSGGPVAAPIVGSDQTWRYFMGLSEPPGPLAVWRSDRSRVARFGKRPHWAEPSFDDADWLEAEGVIGAGCESRQASNEPSKPVSSVYLRRRFTLPEDLATGDVEVAIDFKDGLVAFLNGREIGRRNLGGYGAYTYHDQRAYQVRRSSEPEKLLIPATSLRSGDNLLALQVHGHDPEEGGLKAALQIRSLGGVGRILSPWTDRSRCLIGTQEPSGSLVDEDGDHEDWIEIFNGSSRAVSLEGWSLTDDAGSPQKWRFPARILGPREYVVVFSSGKDRRPRDGELHTNFRLRREGEYLALYSGRGAKLESELSPYPRQIPSHSWGLTNDGYRYLARASPGSANHGEESLRGILEPPRITVPSGFYEGPISVAVVPDSPRDIIYFTLDGSEPSMARGRPLSTDLRLDETTVLRTRTFRPGFLPSPVTTSVFLIDEDSRVQQHPVVVISGDPEAALFEPHGVLAIVGGHWTDIQEWCVACWVPQGLDDFNHPMQRGRPFERLVTVTFFEPGGQPGPSLEAGLRFAGGNWRRRTLKRLEDWSTPIAKSSFRLYFRRAYGRDELDYPLIPSSRIRKFKTLTIRGGLNDPVNPFIRDELVRRLHADMGHVAALGTFASVFLNGDHKGYFNVVERLDEHFFRKRYGDSLQWDILRGVHRKMVPEVASGDLVFWEELFSLLSSDHSGPETYRRLAAMVDVPNFVDYLLLNAYAATADWPNANWVVARPRAAGGRFRFYVWDAEGAFGTAAAKPVDYDTVRRDLLTVASPVTSLFQHLAGYGEFRRLFAERYRLHASSKGALGEENVRRRFSELQAAVGPLVEAMHDEEFDTSIPDAWIPQRLTFLEESLRQEGLIVHSRQMREGSSPAGSALESRQALEAPSRPKQPLTLGGS